ncbi:LysM peptidoglycan-binding domain-containing protein [Streptomyces sp. NPDC058486]|uniref:LysM peptidoglycan-binding domain-containing protein n=1 Tax=unclassified Streptomyces TaxID=2593676 RepID=UPI0036557BCC
MPAHASLGRRLTGALASTVVLAAVTVGLPWILAQATAVLWDSGTDAFAHLLTRQDTGSAFLLALVAVGWIAWATFLLSLLVEIPARFRGRTAPRLPGLGLSQRAAGTLVSGILVLFTSSTLASAAPAPAAAQTVPARVDAQEPASDRTAEAPAAIAVRANGPTYTVRAVRPAESLWSIAEKLYGQGELYTKIADANEGRTMVDGTVFHADAPIRPGWTLRLPDTPTTPPPLPAQQADIYTVADGDTLWQVAEAQLGDGDQYPLIYEANKGKPQPDGGRLTDPGTIRAGWQLTIPSMTPMPVPDQVKTPAGSPSRTATPPSASPAPVRPHTPVATPSVKVPPPSPAPTTRPEAERATDDEATNSPLSRTAGIGMLAAGSLLVALGTKRMLQRRRREPGQLPARTDHDDAEQTLHAASDPGSLELLDLALRTLAHRAEEEGIDLPAATGARITARTVELLLATDAAADLDGDDRDQELPEDGAARPVAPFTRVSRRRWALDRRQALLDAADAADVPAPYPGLVTLGTDPDGNHLLINLNVSRILLLDGDPTAVRDTARVLALEAATSTWSDHAEIITVGLGDELPRLLPQNRLRSVPHLAAARADLAELLLEQRQQADGDDAPPRMPWTLVCAAAMEEDEAKLLADTLTAARELPVALILPAQGTAGAFGAFDDAVQLAVGTDGPQHVDVLDTDLIVQSLAEDDYRAFAELLRQADEPAQPAEEPWTKVPPVTVTVTGQSEANPTEVPLTPFAAFTASRPLAPVPQLPAPVPAPEQEGTESFPKTGSSDATRPDKGIHQAEPAAPAELTDKDAPEVQVLGPVSVTGIQASGHGPKLAQLAAHLYFRPGPPDSVREAMDPRSPWSPATLQNRISQLRNRLGAHPDGSLYLPRDRTGVYKLSPKVRCDWDHFTHLAERGLAKGPTTGIPDLEAALALVRGRPFGGTPPAWAAARYQEMLVRIIDTAHTLATWHRTGPRPDLTAARRAVRQGLDIDDSAELLYQGWMLIEHQAGNREGVRTVYETLLTLNRRLDVSTEPETEAVYERIMNRSA